MLMSAKKFWSDSPSSEQKITLFLTVLWNIYEIFLFVLTIFIINEVLTHVYK